MTSKQRSGNDPEARGGKLGGLGNRGGRPILSDAVREALANTPPKTAGGRGHSTEWYEGRRSLGYELVESGGMTFNQLGLEILFLLPDDFVEEYSRLFHMALSGGGGESVMHGRSGGLEKAPGQKDGIVTGSDTKLQASGSGKKFKNTPMFVAGDGSMLEVKKEVDRRIKELVRDMRDVMRSGMGRSGRGDDEGSKHRSGVGGSVARPKGVIQCRGTILTTGQGGEAQRRSCGRFLKVDWAYCPNCGSKVE